jgi:hypothetical protein
MSVLYLRADRGRARRRADAGAARVEPVDRELAVAVARRPAGLLLDGVGAIVPEGDDADDVA